MGDSPPNANHMSDDEFKKKVLEGLAALNKRLIALETGQTAASTRLDSMEGKLNKVEDDLGRFRSEVDDRFTQLHAAVQIVYDGVREVLDQQDVEAKERMHFEIVLKRHERWITGLASHAKVELNRS